MEGKTSGRLLTNEKKQEARWAERLGVILHRPTPLADADMKGTEIDPDVNTDPPDKQEIIAAIKNLKNGTASGQDNLNAELFKADPELSAKILQPLFTAAWEGKQVPDDWTKGVIIRILKKGALCDCKNWCGFTLLSTPSKILATVIIQRISYAVDEQLRKKPAGYRKGRGCADQIFTLRNVIEQCTEWQRQLYINFMDSQKAFDIVYRDSLWGIVRAYRAANNFSFLKGHMSDQVSILIRQNRNEVGRLF